MYRQLQLRLESSTSPQADKHPLKKESSEQSIPVVGARDAVQVEVSGAGDGVPEAALVHGAVEGVVLLELVVAVLVDDEDAARLELAHVVDVVVGPHGGADDEVVEAVAVQVARRDGVAEVGADLEREVIKSGCKGTGLGQKVVPRLRECMQSPAVVESKITPNLSKVL